MFKVTIIDMDGGNLINSNSSSHPNLQRSCEKRSSFIDVNHFVMKCDYMNACLKFKNSLCLPGKNKYKIMNSCVIAL